MNLYACPICDRLFDLWELCFNHIFRDHKREAWSILIDLSRGEEV